MEYMQKIWEALFEAVNQNGGDVQWVRGDSYGEYPYGIGVAQINGTPVAAAWITDGDCEYFDPTELDQKLAEYDAVIADGIESEAIQ